MEVRIQFNKYKDYDPYSNSKYYIDRLMGLFYIKKNGQIIYNTMTNDLGDADIRGVTFTNYETKFVLTYSDRQMCDISGTVEIWRDAANNNQLHWRMFNDEQGIIFLDECPQAANADFDFTLPKNMIFQKVN